MDNKLLEYIIAIAEEGSLSKAAERLFITQSALSQQLAVLKKEGLPPLFKEKSRRMELTDAGKIYLNAARAILRTEAVAMEEIGRLDRKTSRVIRIAADSIYEEIIYTKLFNFIKTEGIYEEAELLSSNADNTRAMLESREADMAIVPDIYMQTDFFHYEELYRDELVYVSRSGCDSLPLVIPRKGSFLRELVKRKFSELNIRSGIYAETDSVGTALRLAASGEAAAILPRRMVPDSGLILESFENRYYYNIVCIYRKNPSLPFAERVAEGMKYILKGEEYGR